MNGAHFGEAIAQILNEPEMKERVAKLYGGKLSGG